MRLFIVVLLAFVILQVMSKPIESEEGQEEIDPVKLQRAIKNVGKFQKALKTIEANLREQQLEQDGHHQKAINKKSFWGDVADGARDINKIVNTLGKWF